MALNNNRGGVNLAELPVPPRAPIALGPGIAFDDHSPPRKGYIRFCNPPGMRLFSLDMFMIGEAYMLPDGYSGGWQIVERDGNVDATVWTSSKPLQQAFPVLLDRLHDDGNIEDEWHFLELLARPANGARPPLIRVVGPALHKDRRWFIGGIDTDEESWVRDSGRLVRVEATITLTQHVSVDVANAKSVRSGVTKKYAVSRRGEDCYEFAKRVLGTRRKGPAVAKLNKIKNPRKTLKTGSKLRLPS